MDKMMNLPTDFVRRAAANVQHVTSTVTSTVSTVANVATGRRNSSMRTDSNPASSDGLAANAKDKVTLLLKCTPSKDALTTSSLAVKAGYLMKRNEQGNWQNRFLCVVPHMFLYYYDNDMGEAPRGVIDLELYTNVTREDGVLKVMPSDDGPGLRSFYFNHDDPEYLNEWITSLIRDRYHAVCDERNAYQQMQFDLTGAIDQASTLRKMSEREREDLEKQLSVAQREYQDCKSVLTQTLVLMGITEEDMVKLTDPGKLGQKLRASIGKMKESYERRIEQLEEQMEELRHLHVQELCALQSKLDAEVGGRKNLETLIVAERQRFHEQIAEGQLQADALHVNINILNSEKQLITTKAKKLNEEKKVLIKEIKGLRHRGEELEKMIGDIKELNVKLEDAARDLMTELEGARNEREEWRSKYQDLLANRSVEKMEQSSEGERDSEVSRDSEFSKERIGELLNFNANMREAIHSPSPLPTIRTSSPTPDRSVSPVPTSAGEEGGEEESAHASLQQLAWLSAEQQEIVQARMATAQSHTSLQKHADQPPTSASSTPHASGGDEGTGRRSSMSMLLGAVRVMGGDKKDGATNANSTSSTTNNSATTTHTKRTSMFSSLLGSAPSSSEHAGSSEHGSHTFFSTPFSRHPSAATAGNADEEESRMPLAYRLKCLRCGGSVEGPKYSTCKCSTPALLPEDLQSGGVLRGILSRGSVAGGLVGGMVGGLAGGLAGGLGSLLHGSNTSTSGTSALVHGVDTTSTHGISAGVDHMHVQGQPIVHASVPRVVDDPVESANQSSATHQSFVDEDSERRPEASNDSTSQQEGQDETQGNEQDQEQAQKAPEDEAAIEKRGSIDPELEDEEGGSFKGSLRNSASRSPMEKRQQRDSDDEEDTAEI